MEIKGDQDVVFGEFQSCSSVFPCQDPSSSLADMASCSDKSDKSPYKANSLHQLLGGGIFADVLLWRRRDITVSILIGAMSAWCVFEVWGYTLLSLLSNVFLLLISILFLWSKASSILNRPPPPIPEMQISEEAVNEIALYLQSCANKFLSIFQSIVLGKNTELFYLVVSCLWLVSLIGSFTSLTTSFYICVLILLVVPVLYEKYEDFIDMYLNQAHKEVLMYERIYEQFCFECYNNVKKSIKQIVQEES
ncbi:hypothetical protein LUZ60_012907 [Juncus effusus]|nr:hypothetical protein LUZ60_012907 [Juncus effusus]